MIAILGAAVLPLTQINADAYRPVISAAIESGLGRRVEIRGPLRLNPLRFGFSLEQVVIHEDARFGIEPLAYVSSLDAMLRWSSIVRGRLEFSRLRLVEPSLNLARTKAGWNIAELLRRTLASDPGARMRLPALEVTGGRLNLRLGETKSVYYFGDTDLRMDPPDEWGRIELYFDGVPVRSDRGMRGFGRLSARGAINFEGGEPGVALRLALERSAVSEILMLVKGQGTGIGGFVSAQATVTGNLRGLKLEGRTQVEEFERWSWVLGSGRGPALNWTGTLDLDQGALQLATASGNLPVAVQVRASEIPGGPVWGVLVTMRGAPADSVKSLAAEFGMALPPVEALGKLDGAVSYDAAHGFRGEFDLTDAAFRLPEWRDAAVAPKVQLVFDGGKIKVLPSRFQVGRDGLTVEGEYQFAPGLLSTGAAVIRLTCDDVDVARLRRLGAPFPPSIRQAQWQGSLIWESTPEVTPVWRGEGVLRDGEIAVGGTDARARFAQCRVRIRRSQVESAELDGTIGGSNIRAAFRRSRTPGAPDEVEIILDELAGSQIGAWLVPSSDAPPRGGGDFLERALRAGPLLWTPDRGFRGNVRISKLEWPEVAFAPVTFQIQAADAGIEIAAIHARSGAGAIQGHLRAGRGDDRRSLDGTLTLHQLPWREGHVDGKLELAANSSGATWTGILSASDVQLVPGEAWTRFVSRVDIRRQDGKWRWRLSEVEIQPAEAGAPVFRGHGGTMANGQIQLEISNPVRLQRYVGGLWDGPWEPVR
jgi:hypothetical protein